LLTGRTHQIRVHFASIGHPIVWDKTYWNEKTNKYFKEIYGLWRQFLHSYKLSFNLDWIDYNFEAPLKNDIKKIIN
jgi:23S rRNA-/tRNA-specific pseudouridylate synthase